MGIIPNFKGVLVHDCFSSYFSYDNCTHAICNEHLLRDLQRVIDTSFWERNWASKIKNHLYYIKSVVDKAKALGKKKLDPSVTKALSDTYSHILASGFQKSYNISSMKGNITRSKNATKKQPLLIEYNYPPLPDVKDKNKKQIKQSFGKNLFDRLIKYKEEILLFMYNFDVPFTNNLAERDIRMIKVKQKISGCFRGETGENYFCLARGFTSSMKKQGHPILLSLSKIFDKSFVFS